MRLALFYVLSELRKDRVIGHPPILRLPNRQHHTVVNGQLLLLCVLHRIDLIFEHHHNTY